MSGMFLDPKRPLSTCSSANCKGCPLQSRMHCHFNGGDLARFLLIAFPPFILGGIGIVQVNTWLLLPWIVFCISYFGFIEIRVMCSHCPHYAEPGTKVLQCWANYGSPKLWKYRPGPMTPTEKFVFFAGLALIVAYPLVVLVISTQWLILALFAVLVLVTGAWMQSRLCTQCMNFACPLNRVEPGMRRLFFARNPVVAETWKESQRK